MDDPYSSDASPSEAQSAPETADSSDQSDASEESEQSALIDKSVCPGMKVGDKISLTITGVYEDEYQVEYNDADKDDSGEKKSMMDQSTDNFDRLAKEPSEA
jgi:hypothetical protein